MHKIIKYIRKIIPHNSIIRINYTRAKNMFGAIFNPINMSDIQIIGVTGTDGKTTTVEMLAYALNQSGIKYASSSSLNSQINGDIISSSKRSTPSATQIHRLLKKAVTQGVKIVVIEVSSHSLQQWRLFGIKFDIAILTNVTHEHLNFHKTMENYSNTKKKLFTKYLKQNGTAILPVFDKVTAKWKKELHCIIKTYDYPKIVGEHINKTEFLYNNKRYTINVSGNYNTLNAIAAGLALSALKNQGNSTDEFLKKLETFTGIPGRMQFVDTTDFAKDINIIIDFAITQNAMEVTLQSLRDLTRNSIITVFGATGGQHDTSVRDGLTQSVAKYSDIAIVTDDEPYDTPADIIRDELYSQLEKHKPKLQKFNIADRFNAIEKAIDISNDGDTIIISGLGHYTSRTINGNEIPWSDLEAIKTILRK